jgi:V/A-type H+-transporting ATPase subunit D
MADLHNVPPTRSALLRIRRHLAQVRQGYDLLEHKREVLARELLAMIQDAEATEAEAERRFEVAYGALVEVRMRMGVDRLRSATLAEAAEIETQIDLRSVMGVAIPLVNMEVTTQPWSYGLGNTSAALDEARQRWLEVAEILGRFAETNLTVWRVAIELQKTQRRVNALKYAVIPRYEAALQHISDVLEEREREAFVHAKRVKGLHHSASEEEPYG